MQTISSELASILEGSVMEPRPQVIMHLSNNRSFNPTVTTDNKVNERVLVDGYVTPSMKFAFTDSSYLTDDWARTWPLENQDSQVPWLSASSTSSGNFSPPVTITVDYGKQVNCNKITVSSDPFVMRISNLTIDIDKGSGFQTIITLSPSSYLVEVYLQSSDGNTWGTTVNRSFLTQVKAVRVKINAIARPGKAQVYEVDAGIEKDVSDDVLSWSVTKERDLSGVTASPVGISTANAAQVVLDNSSNLYNNENSLSDYSGMLQPNVRFDISLGFKKSDQSYEYIKQGTFYADSWEISADTTRVSVSCRDQSKFLQDKRTPQLFYHDRLIHEIIRDIAERAGILDMDIDTSRLSRDDISPNPDGVADITDIEDIVCVPQRNTVWANEEETYWNFLQAIALADLGVFYFDENCKFKFRVKESLTDPAHPDMRVVKQLEQGVHIIAANYTNELVKNDFTIEYLVPKLSRERVGLWEADNPTILDATTLGGSIGASDKTIPAGDISDWPREGYLKIGGEVIKYNDRTDSSFLECERGVLRTTASSHSGGTTIYEVRKFEFEYALSPATDFSILNTNEVYTEIIATDLGAFKGEIYLQNTYGGKVIVEGTHVQKALEGLPEALILAGRAIEDQEMKTVKRIDEFSIRKWGHQQFSITLPWCQSETHAQSLVEFMVTAYSRPVTFIEADIFLLPHLQVGDMVSINYPRLGHFAGRSFHVVGITLSSDSGSFSQRIRLRSKAGEFGLPDPTVTIWHGVDASISGTTKRTRSTYIDCIVVLKGVTHSMDADLKKSLSVSHSVDATISKKTVSHFIDAFIPIRGLVGYRTDAYVKGRSTIFANVDSLLRAALTIMTGTDGLLLKQFSVSGSADSLVLKQFTTNASVNSLILKQFTRNASIDSLVLKTSTTSHSMDALVLKQATTSHSMDAMLV